MSEPPDRLCVLADRYLMINEAKALENAVSRTGIDVPLVIVNRQVDSEIDPDLEAQAINEGFGLTTLRILAGVIQRERAWSLVIAEKKIAEELGSKAAKTGRVPVTELNCLQDAEFRYVDPLKDGDWRELPPETIELVGDQSDVAVRFGFGLLKGDILNAPEFGVLSFHPADIREYRGLGVPQAWLDGRDRMGVTLQRLNETVDAGEIVAYDETDVSDARTLWEMYDKLNEIKAELLSVGIENLRDPTVEPTIPDSLGPYYSVKRRHTVPFAGQTLLKNVIGHLQQIKQNIDLEGVTRKKHPSLSMTSNEQNEPKDD